MAHSMVNPIIYSIMSRKSCKLSIERSRRKSEKTIENWEDDKESNESNESDQNEKVSGA